MDTNNNTAKKWKDGIVAWFNNLTGDGVVISNTGVRYYVHYSSIQEDSASMTTKRRTLEDRQCVKFTVLRANYVNQVECLIVV